MIMISMMRMIMMIQHHKKVALHSTSLESNYMYISFATFFTHVKLVADFNYRNKIDRCDVLTLINPASLCICCCFDAKKVIHSPNQKSIQSMMMLRRLYMS